MATNKKPATMANPVLKTYGKRPVPYQFPDIEEKMYIGSEVSIIFLDTSLFRSFIFCQIISQLKTKKKRRKRRESTTTFFNCVCVCLHMFLFLSLFFFSF
jgi:hypothetical protein